MQAYLNFDGHCAEAFAFYAKALDGQILFSQTFGDSPMAEQAPKDMQGRIMHISMQALGLTLYGSDTLPDMPHQGFHGFGLSVQGRDLAHGAAMFQALSEGGRVTLPFAPTFWAKGFGMLVDKFGVPWMVNCEQ